MKISVIVPTYKPENYLWKCLDSLNNQTFDKKNFEIILILNGCSEPYDSQIRSFISKHLQNLNLIYIQTDVPGVSNARNIGLNHASGEYITFVDDDDYVSEMYLDELLERVKPHVVSLCKPIAFSDKGYVFDKYQKTKDFNTLKKNGTLPFWRARRFFSGPCMKLIPKDVIGSRRFNTNFTNGEDSLFMFLISDKIKEVEFTSEKAIYYRRIREGSAFYSRKSFKKRFCNSMKMIKEYIHIYRNGGQYNMYFFFTRILGSIKSLIN